MTESPEQRVAQAKRLVLALKFRTVFLLNPVGRDVLAYLEAKFAKGPDLSGTQDAMLLSYLRSAQREVLDEVHRQIQIAESGDPIETPEASTGEHS